MDENAFAVGEEFAADFAFTAENIRQMATLLGDHNPIHHEVNPRYGALVACGGHIAGWAMSFGASSITARVPRSLGREWRVRFRLPVLAGDTMHVVWRVTHVEPHRRGTLVSIEGTGTVARGAERVVALTTDGEAVLLTDG